MNSRIRSRLLCVYKRLYSLYGPQGWWPGRSRLEAIVGAILTQNTAWVNVEKAISNLRKAGALSSPASFKKIGHSEIARLIRPSGYYNIKADRLRNFFDLLYRLYGGSIAAMGKAPTEKLRRELLSVNGIGPETCDSILLYVFNRPVFVIDAYTKRIFSRHSLCRVDADYEEAQHLFMDNLPRSERLYNEYHALIVRLGKEHCKPKPRCDACLLNVLAKDGI